VQSSWFLVDIRHCWTYSLLVYRSANSVSSQELARVLFRANTSITVTATSMTADTDAAISHIAECRFLYAKPVVAWSAGSWDSMPALFLCAGYPMTLELPVTPQVMPATLSVHLSKTMSLFLVGVLGLTPPVFQCHHLMHPITCFWLHHQTSAIQCDFPCPSYGFRLNLITVRLTFLTQSVHET